MMFRPHNASWFRKSGEQLEWWNDRQPLKKIEDGKLFKWGKLENGFFDWIETAEWKQVKQVLLLFQKRSYWWCLNGIIKRIHGRQGKTYGF